MTIYKLGDIVEINKGKLPKNTLEKKWYSKEIKHALLKVKHLSLEKVYPDNTNIFLSNEGIKYSKKVSKNTIIMAEGGSNAGKVNLTDKEYYIDYHIYEILPTKEIDNYYLFSFFKFYFTKFMLLQNGILPSITKKTLLNIYININDNHEKIGIFLKNLDLLITSTQEELKLLKEKKEVLLNLIFSNINKLDNVIYKLGDICIKIKNGGTPTSTNKDYYSGKIPFAKINDLTSQGRFIYKTKNKISVEALNNSQAWIVPKGNILYSLYASIGFVSINKIDITTNQAIVGIIPNNKIVNTNWLYYYLVWIRNKILLLVDLGTQGNLNLKTIKNFKVPISSLKIQEKNSNILKLIDDFITSKEEELKLLKEKKEVLLNLIFNEQKEFD